MDVKSNSRRGEIILQLVDMWPTDIVGKTADQMVFVGEIADMIEKIENDAMTTGYAEGFVSQHAVHESALNTTLTIMENMKQDHRNQIKDAWDNGYREGFVDGAEGHVHQVDGE